MRIPRKVLINGKTWTVKKEHGLARRRNSLGECRLKTRTILIDADQPRADQEIAFLHELLHAIWPYNLVGDRTEERLIEALDAQLHALLKRNKL